MLKYQLRLIFYIKRIHKRLNHSINQERLTSWPFHNMLLGRQDRTSQPKLHRNIQKLLKLSHPIWDAAKLGWQNPLHIALNFISNFLKQGSGQWVNLLNGSPQSDHDWNPPMVSHCLREKQTLDWSLPQSPKSPTVNSHTSHFSFNFSQADWLIMF